VPPRNRKREPQEEDQHLSYTTSERASKRERLREIGGAHGACGCVLDCWEQLLGEFDVSFAILCCKEDDLVCGSMERLMVLDTD